MSTPKVLNCNGKLISLDTPVVMGIVNITPDSFYEGSRFRDTDAIKRRAEEIVAQGGGIIDVGGFSTRPGASDVSEQEECDRVCMAVEAIRSIDHDTPISIDTFRAKVAKEGERIPSRRYINLMSVRQSFSISLNELIPFSINANSITLSNF